ncbi:2OG-Fe(II) oxygenase [Paraneptunicella aestuarii]|uniref:2OG-Fe(II) oxygenase n=1 Tax=Paraneptunicella aestuarii TaxID=2831148 RepID=UPI001E606607|nr:2OG-Fe(II) oxygenase [Paraneptunicella aestuarii]UAA37815.1 2OG-Fe(II) oxygenase [Paraneptunicella aestuarii]
MSDTLPLEQLVSEDLFERIVQDLHSQGFSIQTNALPEALAIGLKDYAFEMSSAKFQKAGIGRKTDFTKSEVIRRDEICWITGASEIGLSWLNWCALFQQYVNRRLFLGLFSYETHFAHYGKGDFYKRHYDAFRGEANRVLSMVVYLNPDWQEQDGGELVLYRSDDDADGIYVAPKLGTVVVFLSEEFPHEVLPAKADRYSIAGWFRVNGSNAHKVDPSR